MTSDCRWLSHEINAHQQTVMVEPGSQKWFCSTRTAYILNAVTGRYAQRALIYAEGFDKNILIKESGSLAHDLSASDRI